MVEVVTDHVSVTASLRRSAGRRLDAGSVELNHRRACIDHIRTFRDRVEIGRDLVERVFGDFHASVLRALQRHEHPAGH